MYSSLFYDLCLLSSEQRLWAAVSLARKTLCPCQGAPQESPLTEPMLLTVLQFYAACKSPACVTLYLTTKYLKGTLFFKNGRQMIRTETSSVGEKLWPCSIAVGLQTRRCGAPRSSGQLQAGLHCACCLTPIFSPVLTEEIICSVYR